MKTYAMQQVRVARASRALVSASRRNNLFLAHHYLVAIPLNKEFAMAGRHRQHARRARSPE
jgi:hypothetical protein